MAALAARNWFSAAISGKRGHSGEVSWRNAMELFGRHADQPEATGDLRGGWLSDPRGAPHGQNQTPGLKQNWILETNDIEHLLVYRTTVKSPAVATRCRPKGRMADLT